MRAARFVKVAYPWRATIDVSSPEPARFYLSLIAQTLRFGSPAARRGGRLWAMLARRGIPEGALAAILRGAGSGRRCGGSATAYVAAAERAWPALVERDPTLPPTPELSVLELARSSATTVFLFAGSTRPVVVAKVARGKTGGVEREVAALLEAKAAEVAPVYLGSAPGLGDVQRGIRGRPLEIVPIAPSNAHRLTWTEQHRRLTDGLERLARSTSKPAPPTALTDGVVELAMSHPGLSPSTRRAVADAAAALHAVPVSVLRHSDTSPQNILFDGSTLSGLVDWENATSAGMPGADIWNAALAAIDKGVGLVQWSEDNLIASFSAAWFESSFGREARRAGRRCAAAAGLPAELHDPLELVFFARRVGRRMARPDAFPTAADVSVHALEQLVP